VRSPFSPFYFLFFLGLLLWITFSIKLGLIALTFQKLGLNPESALTLLITSLFGSAINLPLFTLRGSATPPPVARIEYGLLRRPLIPFTGRTQIAVNVGGCLVPVLFSLYLIKSYSVPTLQIIVATAFVASISYFMSRPIPGVGIGMPILVAPISAALAAIFLGEDYRAPLAYISGSLGVLIGADLLRLKDVRRMAAPVASIGGAGTFDGIFMTGLVAVLLS
jgi:uncharacterized membrane protein